MAKDELKKWREKHKLTQGEAAAHFGVSIDSWRKWEQGKNPIPALLPAALKGYSKK